MQNQGKQLELEDVINSVAGVVFKDTAGSTVVFQPSNLSADNDATKIGFGISNKEKFLYQLMLLANQHSISEKEKSEIRAAMQDIAIFVKELNFDFKDIKKRGEPEVLCELVDPKPLRFYAYPSNPEYIHYLQQLALLNQYIDSGEREPDGLRRECEEAETRFFEGAENEQLRRAYMQQAVQFYVDLPLVHMAALQVVYTPEQLIELFGKPKRAQREKKPKNITLPFYKAGHLIDQQLKYEYPPDNTGQISIFESLQDKTVRKINESGIEQKTIVEGIRLSPSETKVIDSLCKFLNLKSQTKDPDAEDYYAGNLDIDHMSYGGERAVTPKLLFTLHEVTREYRGGEAPGGKEMANVKAILKGLEKKHFLIRYERKSRLSNGNHRGQTLEVFQPLIKIVKYIDEETDTTGRGVSRTEQMLVVLNPIFIDQINSKYIEYPGDINRRTIIAYGSHNLSEAAIRLRDYLMREKSSKRSKSEMTVERLYYFLCQKWMQEGRRKKVIEYTEKAIETVTALGLITKHEVVPAKQGNKYVFHIDKEWK